MSKKTGLTTRRERELARLAIEIYKKIYRAPEPEGVPNSEIAAYFLPLPMNERNYLAELLENVAALAALAAADLAGDGEGSGPP